MRHLVLVVYTAAAVWTAFSHADRLGLWVLHGTGAVAGLVALMVALGLASELGAAQRRTHGPDSDEEEE